MGSEGALQLFQDPRLLLPEDLRSPAGRGGARSPGGRLGVPGARLDTQQRELRVGASPVREVRASEGEGGSCLSPLGKIRG